MEARALTVDEVAAALQIQPRTVRKLAREGDLPAVKIGKLWRFPARAIARLLDERGSSLGDELGLGYDDTDDDGHDKGPPAAPDGAPEGDLEAEGGGGVGVDGGGRHGRRDQDDEQGA